MDSKVFLFFGFLLLSINLLVIWVLNVYEYEELKVRRIIFIWEKYNYKVFFLVYYFIVDFFYDLKNVILGELVFGLYIFLYI